MSSADETDSEVIDGCADETDTLSLNGKSQSKHVPEASSGASSELIEPDQVDIEVQSPITKMRG